MKNCKMLVVVMTMGAMVGGSALCSKQEDKQQTGASACVHSVKIEVRGMTCPACAVGLRNGLSKVRGVQGVQVDVAGGTASITLSKDACWLRDALDGTLEQVVRNAGFMYGGMRAAD